MGAYSYQPLDASRSQIRLLKIDRSLSPTAKVRCHLEVFDLYNAPHYTGLSYRWTYLEPDTAQRPSPEVTKKSMVVDGKLFYVSENLANFLEVFREQPQNEPIWLWIDQICINQEDIPERNQQIRLMSDIYIRCQTVIIWLGEASALAEDAYSGVLKDSYFTRLWIVQEVLLARHIEILAGTKWIDWGTLMRTPLSGSLVSNGVPVATLDLLDRARNFDRGSSGLASLLIVLDNNGCKDPRDHVYGLLGLVSEDQRPEIDYSKTLWEVFLDTALGLCTAQYEHVNSCGMALENLANTFTLENPPPNKVSILQVMFVAKSFNLSTLFEEMRHVSNGGTYNNREIPPGPKKMVAIGNGGGRWWFEFLDARGTKLRIYARAQAKVPSLLANQLSWFNKYSSRERLADTNAQRPGLIVVLANDNLASADCDEDDSVSPQI